MRIACPGCNSEYHVDEGRIPASGLNMKCPRCATVFTAHRDEGAVPLPGGGAPAAPPSPPAAGSAVPLPGAGSDGWEFDPNGPEPGVPPPTTDPFAKVGGAPARAHLVAPPPGAGTRPPPPPGAGAIPPPPPADDGRVPLPPGASAPTSPVGAMPPPLPRAEAQAGDGAVPLPAGGPPSLSRAAGPSGEGPMQPPSLAPAPGADGASPPPPGAMPPPPSLSRAEGPAGDGAVPLPPGGMPPPPSLSRAEGPAGDGAVPLPAGAMPPPPRLAPDAAAPRPAETGAGEAQAIVPPPPPGPAPSFPLPGARTGGEDGLPPLLDAADPSGLQGPPAAPPQDAPFGDDRTLPMSRPPEQAAPDLGLDFGAVDFAAQPPPPAPELPPEYHTMAGAPMPPIGGDALEFDPAAAPPDDALLDFLDAPSHGPTPPTAPHFEVRRASGEIAGSYDRQALLRMLASGELQGDESVSSDGVTWVPIAEVDGFAGALRSRRKAGEAPPIVGAPAVENAPATPRERAAEIAARLRRSFAGRRGIAAGAALVVLGAGIAMEAATPYGFFFRKTLLDASSSDGSAAADLEAARIDLRREELGALQAALARVEQRLAQAPEDVHARALFAHTAFQLQRFFGITSSVPQAQSFVDALVAAGEEGPEVRKAQAAAALAGNEPVRVKALLGEVEGDPAAQLLLADAHLAAQAWDEALAVLEQAIAAAPKSAPALHRQGLALAAKGDAAGAAAKFEAALAAAPRFAFAAVERARLAADGDEPEAAEEFLAAALDGEGARLAGPALADAWALRGEVRARLGRGDAAAAFEEAIAARKGHEAARLGLARLQLDAGKPEAALETLEPLAKKAAKELSIGEALVRARVGAGQIEEAAALVDELAKAHPEAARAALAQGWVAQARGDGSAARAAFRTAIERDAADAAAHVALARSLLDAGRTADAEVALAAAMEAAGGDVAVQVAAGEVRLAAGDADAARAAFDAALAIDPRARQARRGKARALEAQGDDAGAIAVWQELAEADDSDWESRLGLGHALLRQQKADEAASALEVARTLVPENAEVLAALAEARFAAGDAKAAIELVEEAIDRDRQRAKSWYQLSRFQLAREDATSAARSARRAIAIEAGVADFHYQLGLALHAARVPIDALEALREATKIDPAHADAWERQGDVLLLLNAGADAVRAYQQALRKDPARTRLLLTIADSQLQSNRWDEAIATLREARRSGLEEGVSFRLGIAHQEKGRHAEAIRWFNEAAKEAPDDARPWKQLGYAYKATKRIRDSIHAFQRYLDKSPQAGDRTEIEDEIATLRL